MEQNEYDFWAASLQDGYVGKLVEIVESAGGSKELYEMQPEDMRDKLHLTGRMIKHIINRRNTFDIASHYDSLVRENIKFIKYTDDDYPHRLKNIAGKPYAVFIKGNLPLENKPAVAIVGARDCSEYGRLMAEYFGDRLARNGVQIISGMAYGIDGIAQMAAIDTGGKSYAVLGNGVDIVYPKANRRLYERLAYENCGGVISEYVPGTVACSRNFPPRNRIISGLSDLVLVIEAKAKSGTLITADMAMEQGRDVCIVPGRITDPLSVGCINLMKFGAYPVTSVEDLFEHIQMEVDIKLTKDNFSHVGFSENAYDNTTELTADESLIIDNLDFYPRSMDEITKRTGFDLSKVLSLTTRLELKGIIKCIGQGSFVKKS